MIKLIRYHLPTIVKHVLAAKNDLAYQNNLVNLQKLRKLRRPSPPFGINSQKITFFLGWRPLGDRESQQKHFKIDVRPSVERSFPHEKKPVY